MRVLTKNLVTFKRWIGFKDEKFQYYGGSLKMQFLGEGGKGGGSQKNNILGDCLERGLGQFVDLRGCLAGS